MYLITKWLVVISGSLYFFHPQTISPTTLFLAAKVEEQPRKLEHVIKVAHACLNPQEPPLDTKSNVSLGNSGLVLFSASPSCLVTLDNNHSMRVFFDSATESLFDI